MYRLIVLLFFTLAAAQLVFAQVQTNCPTISVIPPAGIIQPGEKFVFTGAVEGDIPKNVSFRWEISGGKIVDGQGTLKISVDAEWNAVGTTITATLNLLGLTEGCPRSASESGAVIIDPGPILIDEFGRLANDAIRTRLNKLFAELNNNPNSQGYIILYGTEKEMAARERLIVSGINFRNYDRSRITIVRAGTHESSKVYTKLYRIPPGAENPTP